MIADYIVGQLSVCFCILVILSLFLSRQREPFSAVMLCAAIPLAGAVMLHYASRSYEWIDSGLRFWITCAIPAALDIAAGAVMAAAFRYWKPSKQAPNRALAMAAALVPVWLAGLGWFFTRENALFAIGETLSLLAMLSFYRLNADAALGERIKEIENHQAMLCQWQMHPHFLFNSISVIRELMNSNPALASAGLENLAGYLRKNLDALTLDRMIPFKRELEHIEQYVMLEKMNPANRFEVVFDLQVIDFSLPALSVQPLVENAIRHGIRALGEEGMVFVVTERHGEMIRIIVEDNGPGFPEDATEQQKQRISHGLENVRRRLETQCRGSLHIHSGQDGTRVVVLIPKEG